MIRIIRTSRLRELLDAEAAGDNHLAEAAAWFEKAEEAGRDAESARRIADDLQAELDKARLWIESAEDSTAQLERDVCELRKSGYDLAKEVLDLKAALDARTREAEQHDALDELRRDVRLLQEAVDDPETGSDMRGRVAVRVVTEAYKAHLARGDGEVGRPWDLLAPLLHLDEKDREREEVPS